MANEIVIVGAGPIGLWLALQIQLRRRERQLPDLDIVFEEKYPEYQRTHTLNLEYASFENAILDDTGVIKRMKDAVKAKPHIRTDYMETELLALVRSLGMTIHYRTVTNVDEDILTAYPNAAMIIGADGVRSMVRETVFGPDNAVRTPLAYSAQIKYMVNEDTCVSNSSITTYPLLKQSHFLSFVSVGKKRNGETPVTIQHFIDSFTYEKIKHFGFKNPVKLFSDVLEHKLPSKLLQDIKTHVGFRLANKEDILVDTVKLTATELPQQRCKKTIMFHNGRCYGLTGDAALALSFFKGMNSGLKLATHFAKAIVDDWDKIIAHDETALAGYEQYYDDFANKAITNGQKTSTNLKLLDSSVHTLAQTPLQLTYYTNNEIAEFQRRFDLLAQVSQFYLSLHPDEPEVTSHVKSVSLLRQFLKQQLIPGLPLLRENVLKAAAQYEDNPKLQAALRKLAAIKTDKLDLYEKAYLALAMSKTCAFLETPSAENHAEFTRFIAGMKTPTPSFYQMLSCVLEIVIGAVGLSLGAAFLIPSVGLSAPALVAGALLVGHGIFQLRKNTRGDSDTYKTTYDIAGFAAKH